MTEIRYMPVLKGDDNKVVKAKDIQESIIKDMCAIEDSSVAMEYHLRIVKVKDAFEKALKDSDYKNKMIENFDYEATRTNQGKVVIDGATMAKGSVHTAYVFTNCNHPVLDFLNGIQAKFKDLVKMYEAELKLIPEQDSTLVDGEPVITGGTKDIHIGSDDLVNHLSFFMSEAQVLIDTVEAESIFTVNRPAVIKQIGIKVTKK